MFSIILVHQGRESMNGRTSGGVFWPAPATYVVSVRVYIRIIVPCYKLILSNCAERAWYLPVTLTRLGVV